MHKALGSTSKLVHTHSLFKKKKDWKRFLISEKSPSINFLWGRRRERGKKGCNKDGHGSSCKIQHWPLKKNQAVGDMGKKSYANSGVEGRVLNTHSRNLETLLEKGIRPEIASIKV